MIRTMYRSIGVVMSLVVVASTAETRPVQDRQRQGNQMAREATFDGEWSVVIQTDTGVCERASRYGLDIKNGLVTYEGSSYGRVLPDGRVHVEFSVGPQRAEGVGRLLRSSGTGVWRGVGSSGTCAGRWFAERRQNWTSGRGP